MGKLLVQMCLCDVAWHMVQAIASEKKNGSGQGRLFGIFHISAFDVADAAGQVKQAAQDAKNAVGNANSELTAPFLLCSPTAFLVGHACRVAKSVQFVIVCPALLSCLTSA